MLHGHVISSRPIGMDTLSKVIYESRMTDKKIESGEEHNSNQRGLQTRTIKMHALDLLNKRGRILRGAIQPIEGVHFYRCSYQDLCDWALTVISEISYKLFCFF